MSSSRAYRGGEVCCLFILKFVSLELQQDDCGLMNAHSERERGAKKKNRQDKRAALLYLSWFLAVSWLTVCTYVFSLYIYTCVYIRTQTSAPSRRSTSLSSCQNGSPLLFLLLLAQSRSSLCPQLFNLYLSLSFKTTPPHHPSLKRAFIYIFQELRLKEGVRLSLL